MCVFVFQDTVYTIITQKPFKINFCLLSAWLCSKYVVKCSSHFSYQYPHVSNSVWFFYLKDRNKHFNEMLFMMPSCSREYEALLMTIHFMPHLFITLGLACVLKPDTCWAVLLWVYTLFSLLFFSLTPLVFYIFSLQPSVNLIFSNQESFSYLWCADHW